MAAAEKSVVSGKRRGVSGFKDGVRGVCDKRRFRLGVAAPEYKRSRLRALVQQADNGVGELFPALAAVRISLPAAHGEHGVQHKHALLCPVGKLAMVRGSYAEVALKLFKNILQRGRWRNAAFHGKAKPVCLTFAVVGVLPDDDRLDVFIRRIFQRIENIIHRGVNGVMRIFIFQKFAKLQVIIRVKFVSQQSVPAVSNVYHQKKAEVEPAIAPITIPSTITAAIASMIIRINSGLSLFCFCGICFLSDIWVTTFLCEVFASSYTHLL